MSVQPIFRPALIAHVVTVAKLATISVGRGAAPKEGGWVDGVQTSNYVDYAVVKAGPARTPAVGHGERMSRFGTSWDVSVQLIGHGETEQRSDEAAYAVLEQIFTIDGTLSLGGVDWEVQKVVVNSLGSTEWSDQEKAWRVVYDVSLQLSRQLPR